MPFDSHEGATLANNPDAEQEEFQLEPEKEESGIEALSPRLRLVWKAFRSAFTVGAFGTILYAKEWLLAFLDVGQNLTLLVVDWCFNISVGLTALVIVVIDALDLLQEISGAWKSRFGDAPGA